MLPEDEQRFVESLTFHRTRRGMSQSELARQMVDRGWPTYSQMTVSRTEKGDRPIRLSEARSLAAVLGVTLDEMITPADLPVRRTRSAIEYAVAARERSILARMERLVANEAAVEAEAAFQRALADVRQQVVLTATTFPDDVGQLAARLRELSDIPEMADLLALIERPDDGEHPAAP